MSERELSEKVKLAKLTNFLRQKLDDARARERICKRALDSAKNDAYFYKVILEKLEGSS